jgi:hypothetical protein
MPPMVMVPTKISPRLATSRRTNREESWRVSCLLAWIVLLVLRTRVPYHESEGMVV